jgi:hypothetical protein
MIAIGASLDGVFCGNNPLGTANFPVGVTYQRDADWTATTVSRTTTSRDW